ncbi:MAG: hypothetical protein A3F10_00675 [Coxiella sp. RIFCSPHIGHO2_12_FULL_42_15]|nr:MAG: hypothetical protein A3F10_00675 [Coxiella sp. RIFCSPHIGHO2_12_FULL_42_15]
MSQWLRVSYFFTGFFFATQLWAGGFQVWEQDASGIGDYHSGAAAEALNAGTQFYNPAGMNHLKNGELSAGIAYIPLIIDYTGTVGGPGAQTTANAISNTNNFIPNFYAIMPIDPHFALGFGVTVPFGASTEYPIDNPIAAAATKTELQAINLNPSIAVKLTKYFSVGVGFDALWGKAIYNSAFTIFTPTIPLQNTLQAWGYGWNAGVLFYLTPKTRLGVSYRSSIQLDGEGQSEYLDDPIVTNSHLTATLQFPATTIFSIYSDITDKWALLLSAYYTQWSVFNSLNLQNVLVLGSPTTISVHEDYVDSWNLAGGVHYKISKRVLLKLGLGYDQTPTQPGFRDVRLPDAPKYALAMGVHWDVIKALGLDVGWIYFFVKPATIDNSQSMTDDDIRMLTQTNGTAKTEVSVIGLQISWKI